MIYYELLDKISSILEDKIEEILFLIENDMRNQRYKFTGEESLYSYMIVLDDVYEVLTPFIQDGNIVENIVGISKRVFDLKLKNASRSNVDIQKIKDKYFSKKKIIEGEEQENYLFVPEMKEKFLEEIVKESMEYIKEADDKEKSMKWIQKNIETNVERKKEEILGELEKDIKLLVEGE